jgi:hypothetical protein
MNRVVLPNLFVLDDSSFQKHYLLEPAPWREVFMPINLVEAVAPEDGSSPPLVETETDWVAPSECIREDVIDLETPEPVPVIRFLELEEKAWELPCYEHEMVVSDVEEALGLFKGSLFVGETSEAVRQRAKMTNFALDLPLVFEMARITPVDLSRICVHERKGVYCRLSLTRFWIRSWNTVHYLTRTFLANCSVCLSRSGNLFL